MQNEKRTGPGGSRILASGSNNSPLHPRQTHGDGGRSYTTPLTENSCRRSESHPAGPVYPGLPTSRTPRLPPDRSARWALLLLLPAPTLGVWMALFVSPGPLGQAVFTVSKVWILLLPALWVRYVDRASWRLPRIPKEGLHFGLVSGLLIAAFVVAAYAIVGRHWIDIEQAREVADEAGLGRLPAYIAAALYFCFINALLEEYVWRWFVYGKCAILMRPLWAVPAAGLCFTIHHIVALMAYFDWRVTLFGSLGVWIGGMTWSWCLLRYRSIWPGYISHIFADLAVFGIGLVLLFIL